MSSIDNYKRAIAKCLQTYVLDSTYNDTVMLSTSNPILSLAGYVNLTKMIEVVSLNYDMCKILVQKSPFRESTFQSREIFDKKVPSVSLSIWHKTLAASVISDALLSVTLCDNFLDYLVKVKVPIDNNFNKIVIQYVGCLRSMYSKIEEPITIKFHNQADIKKFENLKDANTWEITPTKTKSTITISCKTPPSIHSGFWGDSVTITRVPVSPKKKTSPKKNTKEEEDDKEKKKKEAEANRLKEEIKKKKKKEKETELKNEFDHNRVELQKKIDENLRKYEIEIQNLRTTGVNEIEIQKKLKEMEQNNNNEKVKNQRKIAELTKEYESKLKALTADIIITPVTIVTISEVKTLFMNVTTSYNKLDTIDLNTVSTWFISMKDTIISLNTLATTFLRQQNDLLNKYDKRFFLKVCDIYEKLVENGEMCITDTLNLAIGILPTNIIKTWDGFKDGINNDLVEFGDYIHNLYFVITLCYYGPVFLKVLFTDGISKYTLQLQQRKTLLQDIGLKLYNMLETFNKLVNMNKMADIPTYISEDIVSATDHPYILYSAIIKVLMIDDWYMVKCYCRFINTDKLIRKLYRAFQNVYYYTDERTADLVLTDIDLNKTFSIDIPKMINNINTMYKEKFVKHPFTVNTIYMCFNQLKVDLFNLPQISKFIDELFESKQSLMVNYTFCLEITIPHLNKVYDMLDGNDIQNDIQIFLNYAQTIITRRTLDTGIQSPESIMDYLYVFMLVYTHMAFNKKPSNSAELIEAALKEYDRNLKDLRQLDEEVLKILKELNPTTSLYNLLTELYSTEIPKIYAGLLKKAVENSNNVYFTCALRELIYYNPQMFAINSNPSTISFRMKEDTMYSKIVEDKYINDYLSSITSASDIPYYILGYSTTVGNQPLRFSGMNCDDLTTDIQKVLVKGIVQQPLTLLDYDDYNTLTEAFSYLHRDQIQHRFSIEFYLIYFLYNERTVDKNFIPKLMDLLKVSTWSDELITNIHFSKLAARYYFLIYSPRLVKLFSDYVTLIRTVPENDRFVNNENYQKYYSIFANMQKFENFAIQACILEWFLRNVTIMWVYYDEITTCIKTSDTKRLMDIVGMGVLYKTVVDGVMLTINSSATPYVFTADYIWSYQKIDEYHFNYTKLFPYLMQRNYIKNIIDKLPGWMYTDEYNDIKGNTAEFRDMRFELLLSYSCYFNNNELIWENEIKAAQTCIKLCSNIKYLVETCFTKYIPNVKKHPQMLVLSNYIDDDFNNDQPVLTNFFVDRDLYPPWVIKSYKTGGLMQFLRDGSKEYAGQLLRFRNLIDIRDTLYYWAFINIFDFGNFTQFIWSSLKNYVTEELSAEELMSLIDEVFKAFESNKLMYSLDCILIAKWTENISKFTGDLKSDLVNTVFPYWFNHILDDDIEENHVISITYPDYVKNKLKDNAYVFRFISNYDQQQRFLNGGLGYTATWKGNGFHFPVDVLNELQFVFGYGTVFTSTDTMGFITKCDPLWKTVNGEIAGRPSWVSGGDKDYTDFEDGCVDGQIMCFNSKYITDNGNSYKLPIGLTTPDLWLEREYNLNIFNMFQLGYVESQFSEDVIEIIKEMPKPSYEDLEVTYRSYLTMLKVRVQSDPLVAFDFTVLSFCRTYIMIYYPTLTYMINNDSVFTKMARYIRIVLHYFTPIYFHMLVKFIREDSRNEYFDVNEFKNDIYVESLQDINVFTNLQIQKLKQTTNILVERMNQLTQAYPDLLNNVYTSVYALGNFDENNHHNMVPLLRNFKRILFDFDTTFECYSSTTTFLTYIFFQSDISNSTVLLNTYREFICYMEFSFGTECARLKTINSRIFFSIFPGPTDLYMRGVINVADVGSITKLVAAYITYSALCLYYLLVVNKIVCKNRTTNKDISISFKSLFNLTISEITKTYMMPNIDALSYDMRNKLSGFISNPSISKFSYTKMRLYVTLLHKNLRTITNTQVFNHRVLINFNNFIVQNDASLGVWFNQFMHAFVDRAHHNDFLSLINHREWHQDNIETLISWIHSFFMYINIFQEAWSRVQDINKLFTPIQPLPMPAVHISGLEAEEEEEEAEEVEEEVEEEKMDTPKPHIYPKPKRLIQNLPPTQRQKSTRNAAIIANQKIVKTTQHKF